MTADNVLFEIKGLKKNFGDLEVLKGIHTTIRKGEVVVVIGPSGSGKSTFLHLCAGLDKPDAGSVTINGTEITKLSHDKLGRFRGENMGFVFQRHNLIPQFTALENILIPTMMCNKPDMSYQENLRHLVETLDLGDRLSHLPSELSGGQQQRVAIARALINNPDIIMADEPTGALDRKNADEVLNLLFKTREEFGLTLVMVTHDLAIADRADRIFRMDNGELKLERDYQTGGRTE